MADYIYLLENRLSAAQQAALLAIRQVARAKGLTVFMVGGAVRDMTSGSPVRDLDVVVQGNALKLKKDIEKAKAVITGENEAGQSFFARFPGGVRVVPSRCDGEPTGTVADGFCDRGGRDSVLFRMAQAELRPDGSVHIANTPTAAVPAVELRKLLKRNESRRRSSAVGRLARRKRYGVSAN